MYIEYIIPTIGGLLIASENIWLVACLWEFYLHVLLIHAYRTWQHVADVGL